jgi:hypothetical protein
MRTCCHLAGLVLAGVVLLAGPGHEAPGESIERFTQDHDLASGRFPCFRWAIEAGRRPATVPGDPTRGRRQDNGAIVVSPDQIRQD